MSQTQTQIKLPGLDISADEVATRFMAYLNQRGGITLDDFCLALGARRHSKGRGRYAFSPDLLDAVDRICGALVPPDCRIEGDALSMAGTVCRGIRYLARPPAPMFVPARPPDPVKSWVDPSVIDRPSRRTYPPRRPETPPQEKRMQSEPMESEAMRSKIECAAKLTEVLGNLAEIEDDNLKIGHIELLCGFSREHFSRNPDQRKQTIAALTAEKDRRKARQTNGHVTPLADRNTQAELEQLRTRVRELEAALTEVSQPAAVKPLEGYRDRLVVEFNQLQAEIDQLIAKQSQVSTQLATIEQAIAVVGGETA